MRKQVNKELLFKYSVIFYLAAAAWVLLEMGGGFHAALSFLKNMETIVSFQNQDKDLYVSFKETGGSKSSGSQREKTGTFTSMEFRDKEKFQDTLGRYRYFASLYQEENSAPVPGLMSTDILGNPCTQMVPQGICIARDYMLVTAYDNGTPYEAKPGQRSRKVNKSVLYVLSNQEPGSRKLLVTIVLPDINHVGGIAFDGQNAWIAKSTDRQCSVLSYEAIKLAVRSGESSYELPSYGQNVPCGAVASFVTWQGGRLWVGTYSNRVSGMGSLRSFSVKKEHTKDGQAFSLQKEEQIAIPGYANGAAFLEQDGNTYLIVTTSKGRYFDSEVYCYKVEKDGITGRSLYYLEKSFKFPPMAEELAYDGGQAYFLFESSAACYSGPYWNCSYPVDRICAVSASELLGHHQGIRKLQGMAEYFLEGVCCLPAYICNSYWKKRRLWGWGTAA